MPLALGLDFGTTSFSGIALRPDGTPAATVMLPNPAAVSGLPGDCAEQDPQRIFESALQVLRELAARLDAPPVALGLTGQMHGLLVQDAARRPLGNLVTWQDRRSLRPDPRSGRPLLAEFLERCPPEALEGLGCRPSPGYLAVSAFALQRTGNWPTGAARVSCIAEWAAAELCDLPVVADPTHAASTGAYDVRADRWSAAVLDSVGLDRRLFPEVRESGTKLGELVPEIAQQTGLPAGLPVCVALGDNQASVLGTVPIELAGDVLQVTVGTGGQINWRTPAFRRAPGMETRPLPRDPGGPRDAPRPLLLVGAGLAGGDAYAWLHRTFDGWLRAAGVALDADASYTLLGRLVEQARDEADGLTCEPLFRGTRQLPNAKASFAGIGPDNFTPGNVGRAILVGIARGFRRFLDDAGDARPERWSKIVGAGNGLRRNPLLVRAVAETFGTEVWLGNVAEEAACGAALLAGTSVGLWPSLAAAGQVLPLHRA